MLEEMEPLRQAEQSCISTMPLINSGEDDQDEIIEYFKSCDTSSLQVAQEELAEYNFNWEQLKIMRIKFLSQYGM